MKCELVEKLIPLHVGGDLQPPKSESLRQHLATCARCRQLHEEFEAGRSWLREFSAPDFDADVYADLSASVIRQIKQQEKRGSWFQWLLPKWDSRLMLAASAAVLALVTGLMAVTYYHQPAQVVSNGETLATGEKHDPPGAATQTLPPQSEQTHRTVSPRFHAASVQSNATRTEPNPTIEAPLPQEAFQNDPFTASSGESVNNTGPADTTTAEPAEESTLEKEQEKEMLRIELQTADPNIRIIWLTPKSAPARPDTK